MNPRTLAAIAIGLAMNAAAAATADPGVDAATNRMASPAPQPVDARRPGVVVAPPKPTVETKVQPGLQKLDKHEHLTVVLKARKRAGGSDRVVAD